ncbi:ribonuclease III [Viridibacterium curvum]|uniref:Ribonuclease 3 n=1 Tax=Viridibacterium curvum TaxID=1101404 RepID=A0ABP9QWJ5_9RHOO
MSLDALQRGIAYHFKEARLLQQALTHRSFSADHYERLEFLGDSVLNMVIATQLYARFAQLREGELSRLRAQLVRQDALHGIAIGLGLGALLRLGEGELRSGGDRRPSILADATEALIGAVFLDGGFGAAEQLVVQLYMPLLEGLDPQRSLKDPKTALQELLQARRLPLPNYELVETRGEAHQQEFEMACVIPSLNIHTRGSGNSRRIAEQAAAQQALAQIGTA